LTVSNGENMSDNTNDDDKGAKQLSQAEIDAIVAAKVDEQLKDIKEKLNSAYGGRDDAVRKLAAAEAAAKEKEMEALTAAGKHQEVLQMKLTAAEENLKLMQAKITGYERDTVVKTAMGDLKFRNERSREMAYRDIVGQLVQNQEGQWVHKTGAAIGDFMKAFSKDPDNEFLFEVKNSGGGGTGGGSGNPTMTGKKVLEMNTEELLAAATAGKLGTISF
jgi:hypothetical protein